MEATRVDRWLWAVRLCKNRSTATAACRGGHVHVNGATAKPATPVREGDRIEAVLGDRARVVEVARIVESRVGAAIAAECLVDHSAPLPPHDRVEPAFARDPGAGRPTKRQRRQLDRLRDR